MIYDLIADFVINLPLDQRQFGKQSHNHMEFSAKDESSIKDESFLTTRLRNKEIVNWMICVMEMVPC